MKFPGNDCVFDLEHPAALSSRLGGGEDIEVQDLHGEQFNQFFFIAMTLRINFKLSLNLKKNLCPTFDVV